jgi:hypothetical protein
MKKYITLFYLFLIPSLYATEFIQKNKLIKLPNWKQSIFIGNVIQGITYSQKKWFFSQAQKNKISFTILNTQNHYSYQTTIPYSSHGQDLSFIQNKKYITLLTVSQNNDGIAFFQLQPHHKNKIIFDKEIILFKNITTVALSDDKIYLLIRSQNNIFVYLYKELLLLGKNTRPIFYFLLDKKQQKKGVWFQGLTMKDGYIYTLSGNNTIHGKKYLIIYDFYGKVIKSFELTTGKQKALTEGSKWELEGLTFVKNNLFTTVMSGKNKKNIKRLYQILKLK